MARYKIEDERAARSNPFCPRCGEGVMMADKGEWWSCGKCGDRYNKRIHVRDKREASENRKVGKISHE